MPVCGSPFQGIGKLRETVELTQAAAPDLILLAGDYVIHGVIGGDFTSPEEIADTLSGLRAPAGVFAVLGNHDWWLDAERVRSALERVEIPVLEDAATPIRHGDCSFWLVGVSDYWEGPHDVDVALRCRDEHSPRAVPGPSGGVHHRAARSRLELFGHRVVLAR